MMLSLIFCLMMAVNFFDLKRNDNYEKIVHPNFLLHNLNNVNNL
jgi:hypothetical protein